MKRAAPVSGRKDVIQTNEPAAFTTGKSNAASPDQEQAAPLNESRTAKPLHTLILPYRSGFVKQKGSIFMLDISKTPTSFSIADKARALYHFARTARAYALNSDIGNGEDFETICANTELFSELSYELYIMAQVFDDYAAFSDFPECVPPGIDPDERRKLYERGKRDGTAAGIAGALLKVSGADKEPQTETHWTHEERAENIRHIIETLEELGFVSCDDKPAEDPQQRDGEPQ